MKDFFISYNSADQQWAEWIAWQLEEAGYKIEVTVHPLFFEKIKPSLPTVAPFRKDRECLGVCNVQSGSVLAGKPDPRPGGCGLHAATRQGGL